MTGELVIADASPLIGLEQIGQIELIARLFGGVLVPPAVIQEIAVSVPRRDWLRVQSLSAPIPSTVRLARLDPGEEEAVALAIELRPTWLVLDERRARRLAERLGLPVIGTLGILRTAKLRGVVGEVKPLIDALRATRFFVDDRLVGQLLDEMGER